MLFANLANTELEIAQPIGPAHANHHRGPQTATVAEQPRCSTPQRLLLQAPELFVELCKDAQHARPQSLDSIQ